MFRDKHMNLYTIFKRAQLLEAIGAFKRRRYCTHEIKQGAASKSIHPLMPQIFDRRGVIAREGDWVTREVKRIPINIENDLHLVGRRSVSRAFERMGGCDNVDPRI